MSSKQLTAVSAPVSSHSEVVDELSKSEVRTVEKRALNLYKTAERAGVQLAAELCRLQDGSAHLKSGYDNFGDYAEAVFVGLNRNTAQQMSREGRILLTLERVGRITLDDPNSLPGSTGLRKLAVCLKSLGEAVMFQVYDLAAESGQVTERSVSAAVKRIEHRPPLELGAGKDEPTEAAIAEDEDDGYSEEYCELLDRIQAMRELLDDVADSTGNKRTAKIHLDALKQETELLEKELAGEHDAEWLEGALPSGRAREIGP
jgi:hypothetical protein